MHFLLADFADKKCFFYVLMYKIIKLCAETINFS